MFPVRGHGEDEATSAEASCIHALPILTHQRFHSLKAHVWQSPLIPLFHIVSTLPSSCPESGGVHAVRVLLLDIRTMSIAMISRCLCCQQRPERQSLPLNPLVRSRRALRSTRHRNRPPGRERWTPLQARRLAASWSVAPCL